MRDGNGRRWRRVVVAVDWQSGHCVSYSPYLNTSFELNWHNCHSDSVVASTLDSLETHTGITIQITLVKHLVAMPVKTRTTAHITGIRQTLMDYS